MSDEIPMEEHVDVVDKESNWLDREADKIQKQREEMQKDALTMEEKVVYLLEVDFSKPGDRWEDKENKTIKKIIPIKHDGKEKNFWLNVKNPLYAEIVLAGKDGQRLFKIMRTGQRQDTRYTIIKE